MAKGIDMRGRTKVTFYDGRESFSLTVYGQFARTVARAVEEFFRSHWKTTSLNDRRHKRR